MKDLSRQLLPGDPLSALIPTSQHGGNQVWANNAMTAPGGASGDLGNDLNEAVVVDAPVIDAAAEIQPGDDGKPQAQGQQDTTPAPRPAWKSTTVPDVVRKAR